MRLNQSQGPIKRRSNEDAEPASLKNQSRNSWMKNDKPLTPAAVLVPIIIRNEGLRIILTKRTEQLKEHPGQISFPGGRVNDDDRDFQHTALRETEEEIGLQSNQIKIIGELDQYIVGTGYIVNPIVGIIEPPFKLTRQKEEVAEIFEIPLDFAIALENFTQYVRDHNGITRHHFAITWQDYFIWGATAGMLRNLSERLSTG